MSSGVPRMCTLPFTLFCGQCLPVPASLDQHRILKLTCEQETKLIADKLTRDVVCISDEFEVHPPLSVRPSNTSSFSQHAPAVLIASHWTDHCSDRAHCACSHAHILVMICGRACAVLLGQLTGEAGLLR